MIRFWMPLSLLICLMACPASLSAEEPKKKEAFQNVGVEEFEQKMAEKDVVILDVRTPEEYAAGHLKGAVLIDFLAKDFEQKIQSLDKDKTYLVHCKSGRRSAGACNKLGAQKIGKLYNLEGGFEAWKSAGKPVEK